MYIYFGRGGREERGVLACIGGEKERGEGWASERLDARARHGCRGDPVGDFP